MWVANLEPSRVNTCSLYASPTGLSPYLRFGCLSCRVLYYNLRELYMKVLWMQRHNKLICSSFNHSVFDHQRCHQLLTAIFFPLLFFLFFCLYLPTASKALQPSSLPFWTVVMEGVLLHSCYQQPELWPHGRKPHLCPGGPSSPSWKYDVLISSLIFSVSFNV